MKPLYKKLGIVVLILGIIFGSVMLLGAGASYANRTFGYSIPVISPFVYFGGGTSGARTNDSSTQVLVGGTATSTDSDLETGSLAITDLTSEDCIGTDADGNVQSGTCSGGGGGGSGSIATSSVPGVSEIPYFTTSGETPELVSGVATTSLTVNSPLTTSGTPGALIGGTNLTLDVSTTSDSIFSGLAGQVLAFINGGWYGVATTTFSDGLTYSNGNVTNDFSTSIDDTELTAEDFGDFTCDGGEDGCTLDATYLTGNETITLSGDVSGSGATSITTTITNGAVDSYDLSTSSPFADNDIVRWDSDGTFNGITCAELTGSADLCDGNDATGSGVDGYDFSYSQDIGFGVTGSATGTATHFTAGIHASGTSQFSNATSTLLTATTAWLTNLFIGVDTIAEYISDTAGAMFSGNTETGITVTYQDGDNTIDLVVDNLEDLAGTLDIASGGTGATTLNDLITLGTHTTGNYIATISGTTNQISVSGSGSESAATTLSIPSLFDISQASTTQLSALQATFGATASSTFDTAGNLTLGGTITVGGDSINEFAGTGLTVSGNALTADLGTDIAAGEIADGDHGFFSYSSGVATLDTGGITSANLAGALSNETGSGAAVFGTSPTISSPTLSSFFGTACSGGQFLTDIGDTGTFTCATPAAGASDVWATTTGNGADFIYQQDATQDFLLGGTASSSASLWHDTSASTTHIGTGGGLTDSFIVVGPDEDNQWIFGYDVTDGNFEIASSTALGTNTAFEIVQNTLSAIFYGVVVPATNNAIALGTTALSWADLFLGDGSVINWNNGDVTLTHSEDRITIAGGDVVLDIAAGQVVGSDIANDTITYSDILDSDQADTKCIWFEDPTADDDFNSIWANKTANNFLLTEIWAESDQTVNFDLQIDDGTPADVNGSDISPAAGEAEDTSLSGDTTLAAGEELDLAITSVSGTPTWVSICWTGNWVD